MEGDEDFRILLGKTIEKIVVSDEREEILFIISPHEVYKMFHEQNCCESVWIEDICGELDWLVGSPVLVAEERCKYGENTEDDRSTTWTFYEIATIKGSVTIRWCGTSNGYYSERVDFVREKHE